jgi:hypothetical protein
MHIYNVLTENSNPENIIFVEERFSFSAFIFQSAWLLYHKIWTAAFAMISIQSGLLFFLKNGTINEQIFYNLIILSSLITAFFGRTWYIAKLKKNYQINRIIVAKNLEEAKLSFYKNKVEGLI